MSGSTKQPALRRATGWLVRGCGVLIIVALPLIKGRELWQRMLTGGWPRAWDGTGHFAIARIYSQTIFPDVFGWIPQYFSGMPFPNYYPPLFFWLVALIDHVPGVPFPAAFKLILALPILAIPLLIARLAWVLSDRDWLVALSAGVLTMPLLLDYRMYTSSGLDYVSTFHIGLYTQPLGFALVVAWYAVWIRTPWNGKRIILSAALLAAVGLANFFGAITAMLLMPAVIIADGVEVIRSSSSEGRRRSLRCLAARLLSPALAFGLTFVWLVPMLATYDQFVTRPLVVEDWNLAPNGPWVAWYALSALGVFVWTRTTRSRPLGIYLAGCSTLVIVVIAAGTFAPPWIPMQPHRFIAGTNLLLAVPAGLATATLLRAAGAGMARWLPGRAMRWQWGLAAVAAAALFWFVEAPLYTVAFYESGAGPVVGRLLDLADDHRDGGWMVEFPRTEQAMPSLDGRALNSLLGAQGNEVGSVVYREASPSALFYNPVASALSSGEDGFGISSVLIDDHDFMEQPVDAQLERSRLLGIRYVAVVSDLIKERLARSKWVADTASVGDWSVIALSPEPIPDALALRYRPALMVAEFSVKERRRNESGFVRWAEEQFASGWFDVWLARAPEPALDELPEPGGFGALVVDAWNYRDRARAREALRTWASRGPVVLLESDDPLYRWAIEELRPRSNVVEIARARRDPGPPLRSASPSRRYADDPIRAQWSAIRDALDRRKVEVRPRVVATGVRHRPNQLGIEFDSPMDGGVEVPVLLTQSYHPRWRRLDGGTLFNATPHFTLTFADAPFVARFERSSIDWVGLLTSIALGVGCVGWLLTPTSSVSESGDQLRRHPAR